MSYFVLTDGSSQSANIVRDHFDVGGSVFVLFVHVLDSIGNVLAQSSQFLHELNIRNDIARLFECFGHRFPFDDDNIQIQFGGDIR